MGGGGKHRVQRGKALGYKHSQLLEGLAVNRDRQVVAAAHQIDALHFVERQNGAGDLVKPQIPLGSDFQLNQGGDAFPARLLPVDDGL